MGQPAKETSTFRKLQVLIPVFNDWEALQLLLPELDRALVKDSLRASVTIVNDGSTTRAPRDMARAFTGGIADVRCLHLRRNLGHQRAIAVGLSYVENEGVDSVVIVMDGDGEDNPADISGLLREVTATGERAIVFAARRRRFEGWKFRFFYGLYRVLHRALTGIPVTLGNFSVIPSPVLRRLVTVSELWNHYAASVQRARIPHVAVPTNRARRLAGAPTMNFVALVSHGLSAFAVHGELAGIRVMLASAMVGLAILGALTVSWLSPAFGGPKLGSDMVLAMWLAFLMFTHLFLFGALFTMVSLNSRTNTSFIPKRDCLLFVEREESFNGTGETM